MMELADMMVSNTIARERVRVRVPHPALCRWSLRKLGMPTHIRSQATVDLGLLLSDAGLLDRDTAAVCGGAVKTIRRWRRQYQRRGIKRSAGATYLCPQCDDRALDKAHARNCWAGTSVMVILRARARVGSCRSATTSDTQV